jgi:hypothetical protein
MKMGHTEQLGHNSVGHKLTYQQLATDKQELEDIIAMVAHKFRGTLQSIEYNVEHDNVKKRSLDAVHTMRGLLNTLSIISISEERLRNQLKQDVQGESTILFVLEKSLAMAISQLLTVYNTNKISQHYFAYAKRTGQISTTTTRLAWENDYFDLEEQLQTKWENSFSKLLNKPRLDKILTWTTERFFPFKIHGFEDNSIHFKHYGATESTLTIIMTEMILNAIKYYASDAPIPLQIHWHCRDNLCGFVCKNPSLREERRLDKGNGRGHTFLSLIAKKLGGDFPKPPFQDNYVAEFSIPTQLLMEEQDEPVFMD